MKVRLVVAALAGSVLLSSTSFAQAAAAPETSKKTAGARRVVARAGSTTAMSGVSTVAQDKASVLRPPAGSKVAIVIFHDLQCPDCARAHPLLEEAKKNYNIPLVEHDF